jgi:hypothetical protein
MGDVKRIDRADELRAALAEFLSRLNAGAVRSCAVAWVDRQGFRDYVIHMDERDDANIQRAWIEASECMTDEGEADDDDD